MFGSEHHLQQVARALHTLPLLILTASRLATTHLPSRSV